MDSRGSRDLKVVNGVKDHSRKHTCERVHVKEFTAIHSLSRPFTAFHVLCVPVNRFTCELVHRVFTPLGRKHTVKDEPSHLSSFTRVFP